MASWPPQLSNLILSGYSATDDMPFIETPMETGPIRRTRLTSYHMTDIRGSLVLENQTQANAFRQLLKDSNYGADWITGVPLDTGTGVVARRARLVSPSWTVLVPGKMWSVSMTIETDDQAYP